MGHPQKWLVPFLKPLQPRYPQKDTPSRTPCCQLKALSFWSYSQICSSSFGWFACTVQAESQWGQLVQTIACLYRVYGMLCMLSFCLLAQYHIIILGLFTQVRKRYDDWLMIYTRTFCCSTPQASSPILGRKDSQINKTRVIVNAPPSKTPSGRL